jgi:hypothetical protein
MTTDFSNISSASAVADSPTVNVACTSLRTHVENAQAYGAVPDAEARTDWSTALAQAARAATDCIAGTGTLNASLITQSGQEMKATTAAIDAMTTRLKAFH